MTLVNQIANSDEGGTISAELKMNRITGGSESSGGEILRWKWFRVGEGLNPLPPSRGSNALEWSDGASEKYPDFAIIPPSPSSRPISLATVLFRSSPSFLPLSLSFPLFLIIDPSREHAREVCIARADGF